MKKLILKAMKKIALLVVLPWLLYIYSCKKDDNLGCHIDPFVYKHEWLKQLVQKAEDGTNEFYYGRIYKERYRGYDVIYCDWVFSSLLIGEWYNMDGSRIILDSENLPNPKKTNMIYSNICKPPKKPKQ